MLNPAALKCWAPRQSRLAGAAVCRCAVHPHCQQDQNPGGAIRRRLLACHFALVGCQAPLSVCLHLLGFSPPAFPIPFR